MALAGSNDRPSGSSDSSGDPVLSSALAEMATEGFRADDPVGSEPATTETDPVAPQGHTPSDAAPSDTRDANAPASSAPTDPPGSAPAQPQSNPQDDEFAKAPPISFTVDGQQKTFEFLKVFPGEGGLIREADLPKLQQVFSDASHYLAQSQQLARNFNDLERLTEWTHTAPDGSKQTLTGAQAIHASRIAHGSALAELHTLKEALKSPENLVAWSEEEGRVVLRPDTLETLALRAENLANKLHQGIASRFSAPSQPASPAAPNVEQIAPNVVSHVAKQLGVSGLTEQDTAQLAAMVPRYVRPATEADRQANPMLKIGEPLVDSSFHQQVQYLASLRTEAAKQQTAVVSTAQRAATHNSAMNRARQPGKAPVAPAKPAPPAPTTRVGKNEQWQNILADGLAAVGEG